MIVINDNCLIIFIVVSLIFYCFIFVAVIVISILCCCCNINTFPATLLIINIFNYFIVDFTFVNNASLLFVADFIIAFFNYKLWPKLFICCSRFLLILGFLIIVQIVSIFRWSFCFCCFLLFINVLQCLLVFGETFWEKTCPFLWI